jgi:AcrR family transcriptional regulator
MARPVGADAEQTKKNILEAASRLVAERGIEGTSIRDIAGACNVSLATVLHYYGSKDGLYEACIDAMYTELDQLRAALFAGVRPGGSLEDLLADTVRAALKFVKQHRPAHRILLRTVLEQGGMRADRRDRYLRPFLDDVTTLLAPVLGADPIRVRMTAQSLVHLIVRYSLHPLNEMKIITDATTEDEVNKRLEQHLIDITLSMMLPLPPGAGARPRP